MAGEAQTDAGGDSMWGGETQTGAVADHMLGGEGTPGLAMADVPGSCGVGGGCDGLISEGVSDNDAHGLACCKEHGLLGVQSLTFLQGMEGLAGSEARGDGLRIARVTLSRMPGEVAGSHHSCRHHLWWEVDPVAVS